MQFSVKKILQYSHSCYYLSLSYSQGGTGLKHQLAKKSIFMNPSMVSLLLLTTIESNSIGQIHSYFLKSKAVNGRKVCTALTAETKTSEVDRSMKYIITDLSVF